MLDNIEKIALVYIDQGRKKDYENGFVGNPFHKCVKAVKYCEGIIKGNHDPRFLLNYSDIKKREWFTDITKWKYAKTLISQSKISTNYAATITHVYPTKHREFIIRCMIKFMDSSTDEDAYNIIEFGGPKYFYLLNFTERGDQYVHQGHDAFFMVIEYFELYLDRLKEVLGRAIMGNTSNKTASAIIDDLIGDIDNNENESSYYAMYKAIDLVKKYGNQSNLDYLIKKIKTAM